MEIEYKVVSASTKEGLSKEVTEHLNKGWEIGGLAVYQVPNGFEPVIYVQALVKTKKALLG